MNFKKIIRNIIITLLIGFVIYYFTLPPLNLSDPAFWIFLVALLIIYFCLSSFSLKTITIFQKNMKFTNFRFSKVLYVIILLPIIILLINFVLSPLFNAKGYANRIVVDETKEFTTDVPEVNFDAIPLLDKDSSQKLGDRTMGVMTDLVSQFYVSDLYTQINYNNEILRVTPLEYASIIKYFTNRDEGIKGYITVNSVDGEAKLVRLENGMRYMPSSLFFENLYRKLRFSYPTKSFGEASFEIDNEGNPYWIVETLSYTGVGLKKEVSGVVVLDPITGNSQYYDTSNVPIWIDHVYDASLIIEQFDNWGEYKNGYFNSIFGQKGVVNTTEGYSYLAMNDDIYLYTGVTSVSSDESNLGFILTNMRTKETNYYAIAGAEEFSAMASAEGLVQEKGYTATFPLLINLNNKPTYLMSLKDNAGLVKMYALVDVVDYQKVITSDATSLPINADIELEASKYLNENSTPSIDELKKTKIQIQSITTVVIDGTTNYYFTDLEGNKYTASIKINKGLLPFVKVNDILEVEYYIDNELRTITKIS